MSRTLLTGNSKAWDLLFELFADYYSLAEYGDELEKLTNPQRVLCLAYLFDKEVGNGSFDQFFFNSAGNEAHETVEALQTIGAAKTAALLQTAIAVWPDQTVPKDWETRRNVIEVIEAEVEDTWNNCTRKFYRGKESISELLCKYVDANPADFEFKNK